jgi:predicted nucleic acid-binding protein
VKVFYFDASAAMKLLREEKETRALIQWQSELGPDSHQLVTSDILRTELMLAGTRWGVSATEIRRLVNTLTTLRVTSSVSDSAGRLSGLGLRSLDAVHLASALTLEQSLHAVVTYDKRMVNAAEQLGLPTISPA